ncbi:MAG: hypothetical protein HZY75_01670 [Nocardioidaceae bacterium]|nr:MAG: hypothetical protein HZY75_01670 [Nocardioidaceae bacterium]
MGSDLPEEEANVVYFFEVFTDLEARNFHIENPDAMAAKELWWDDLLVSRSPILLDMVWAKGMTSIGEAAWLNNYGPEQLSTVEAGIQ